MHPLDLLGTEAGSQSQGILRQLQKMLAIVEEMTILNMQLLKNNVSLWLIGKAENF